METTRDVKDIARHNPLTIGISSKQSIVLINRDSSTDSLSKMQFCPAYRFCRELKRPYRLSKFDGDHDQQVGDIFLYEYTYFQYKILTSFLRIKCRTSIC